MLVWGLLLLCCVKCCVNGVVVVHRGTNIVRTTGDIRTVYNLSGYVVRHAGRAGRGWGPQQEKEGFNLKNLY